MKNKKVISISEFFSKYFKKIGSNIKLAFLVTACSTFISHIVYFINRWANEDDFHEIMGQLNMIGSGRWMPGTVLSSDFLAPVVLLIIAIVFISLMSVMIVDMFKIKKKSNIVIVSILLSTFPVLALGFGYGFMVERYVLGMFFAVMAVYITGKFKYGFILGAISLAITMGYYQSYIAITISLVILLVIIRLLKKYNNKENLFYVLKYLLMGLIGVALYMVMVRLVCHFTNTPLLDYKGINNMGSLPPLSEFGPLLYRTYRDFFAFFLGKKFIGPLIYGKIAQLVLVALDAILVLYIGIKQEIYKKPLNFIGLILFIVCLPLGFNVVDFIAYESEVSSLNIYQFIFVLILPFILIDLLEEKQFPKVSWGNFLNITNWIIFICGLMLVWNNFVITNIYYLKINDYYTSTVQLTNRVYDRIEQYPGYNGSIPVMVGNKEGIYMDRRVYKDYYKIISYDQGLWDQFIGYAPRPEGTDFKFHYLVENIIGVHLPSAPVDKYEEIYESEEYDEMVAWPQDGCIKYIDDILVVKIS